jgi:hypothetical protein
MLPNVEGMYHGSVQVDLGRSNAPVILRRTQGIFHLDRPGVTVLSRVTGTTSMELLFEDIGLDDASLT